MELYISAIKASPRLMSEGGCWSFSAFALKIPIVRLNEAVSRKISFWPADITEEIFYVINPWGVV